LREGAKAAPNFNGHYRVVEWGCGTNCIEWAIVDLASGRVWLSPEPALSCWSPDESETSKVPDWFSIKVDSRLLALHECTHPGKAVTFDERKLFEWRRSSLHLLRRERFRY
jgi:hypothetical protein